MALAIAGGPPSKAHYRDMSRSLFGKALVKTGKAIRDPVESLRDETLVSVLLLTFYEVRVYYSTFSPISLGLPLLSSAFILSW